MVLSGRSSRLASRETDRVTVVKLPDGGRVQAYGYTGVVPRDGHETPDWALYLDEAWRNYLDELGATGIGIGHPVSSNGQTSSYPSTKRMHLMPSPRRTDEPKRASS